DHPFPVVAVRDADTHVEGIRLVVSRADGQIAGTIVDEAGTPVADVAIGVALPGETMFKEWVYRMPTGSTVTGRDGRFVVGVLPPGPQTLVARPPAGNVTTKPDVASGSDAVTIVLPAETEIIGTLEGFTGDVWVSVQHAAGGSPATVEGSRFRVDGVPHGAVVVSAVSGAQMDAVRLEVAPPGAQVTLRARPTFQVHSELVDHT